MNIGIDFFRDLAVTETAMDVYGYIESGFDCIVRYCILALEMVGVFVLMGSVLRAIIAIFRKKENLRLQACRRNSAFSGIQNRRGAVAHSHCPGVERTLGGGDHHPFPGGAHPSHSMGNPH